MCTLELFGRHIMTRAAQCRMMCTKFASSLAKCRAATRAVHNQSQADVHSHKSSSSYSRLR